MGGSVVATMNEIISLRIVSRPSPDERILLFAARPGRLSRPRHRRRTLDGDVLVDPKGTQQAAFAALEDREPGLGRHVLGVDAHDRVLERANPAVVRARAL